MSFHPSEGETWSTESVGGDPRPRYSKGWRSSQGQQKSPSKYDEIKAKCLKERRLFEDPDFPADDSVLFYNGHHQNSYEWKRPKEILGGSVTPEFFVDGAGRFDIKQRDLGDCWVLATMSCLSMNPDLINKVVPAAGQSFKDGDYAGIFRFNIWSFGEWVEVIIDDRLPTDDNGLVYTSSSKKNEFWTALLEKAYAKLHRSYKAIQGGKSIEAMEDFTGGIGEIYDELRSSDPSILWNIMVKAHERKSLICCATGTADGRASGRHLPNGLVQAHAYSVTRVTPFNTEKFGHLQMVRVRNPHGEDDQNWIGEWNDKSKKWNDISSSEKKMIGFTDEENGEFWVTFTEFVKNFVELHICHLNPECFIDNVVLKEKHWEAKCHEGCWMQGISAGGDLNGMSFWINPQYAFEVVDVDDGDSKGTATVIIALMQKFRRKDGLKNLRIGYTIYKLPKPMSAPLDKSYNFKQCINRLQIEISDGREIRGRHDLHPGSYCVIPFTTTIPKKADFILRIFTEKPVNSKELDEPTAIVEPMPAVKPAVKPVHKDIRTYKEILEGFQKISGDDLAIDACELQEFLNKTFVKEFKFDGFSSETCRSLVALEDIDRSGKLGYGEFMILWNLLQKWTPAFKKHDADGNGTFDSFELRQALRYLGYNVSNQTFTALVQRYSKGGKIHFDDFVHCMARLNTMCEVFKEMSHSRGDSTAHFNLDQFLQTTMYS